MKSKFIPFVILFCCAPAVLAQSNSSCVYIAAKKGTVMYADSDLTSEVLKNLWYGKLIEIIDSTGKFIDIKKDGKLVKSQWLKVASGDVYLDTTVSFNKYISEIERGYIPDIYLSSFLKEIPEAFLSSYSSLNLDDSLQVHINHVSYNGHTLNSHIVTLVDDSSQCGCFSYDYKALFYYDNQKDYPFIYDAKKDYSYPIERNAPILDTLKYFIELEIIDINKYITKKVNNRFVIDTAQVQAYNPEYDESYYLPLNNGKDSMLVNNENREYDARENYIGQITLYNKYVLEHESFFGHRTFLIDKKTGERTDFTSGTPHISPNGRFVVDFHESFDYELNELYGAALTISTLQNDGGILHKTGILFRSFIPADNYEFNPFWVSDKELVIKVYPTDNIIYNMCFNKNEYHPQYLKVKLKQK